MSIAVDGQSRRIDYLRVSITDRCNLRCRYCMPGEGVPLVEHADLLTYEEILRTVEVFSRLGLSKVRLTGGEPLLRRNVAHLIHRLTEIPGIEDVGLTTNGVLLEKMAGILFAAGLRRINISLDTLNPLKFRKITGYPYHDRVLAGILAAERAGFSPIKINVVVMNQVNDDELESFGRLSMAKPYAVRFIEYMPVGNADAWDRSLFLGAEEMRSRLERLGRLIPVSRSSNDGPARRFRFESALGEIGFISPVSDHFCDECDRLRLTLDGKLRPCLASDKELDVFTALRSNCSDEELSDLILKAIAAKPKRHGMGLQNNPVFRRGMSRIGG